MNGELRPAGIAGCLVMVAIASRSTVAQTCFTYVDDTLAKAPIQCVSASDPTLPCSWSSDCTLIPSSSSQTVLAMHHLWHGCFGSTGGSSPPAGRGQRWYAFHRQFEFDYNLWRDATVPGLGHVESIEWCPGIVMPYGHPSAEPGGVTIAVGSPSRDPATGLHVSGCGDGNPRPDGLTCDDCEAFPACLFYAGAGPVGCSTGPSTSFCPIGITSLEDFGSVDAVANVLDSYFHGAMHGAVGNADGGTYIGDIFASACSPRDPMFWRLHKALDDVVRAWQDQEAVDVVLVIDRSGSMGGTDSSGDVKLDAAIEAADMFADLMEHSRSDGVINRIGVVSYSSSATTELAMTDADASLRAPGGPFETALSDILSTGPGGCTSIGAGIERALELLCPPGDCSGFSAAGDNDRKAILLLTDGFENVPPCLLSAGGAGGTCGTECFGAAVDWDALAFTQVVAVGFGPTGGLNGELLTLLAERQGGIYVQNPDTPGDDLKDFFVKAFGTLTDEFLLYDPKGTLATTEVATPPVRYQSCQDGKLTFAAGWETEVTTDDLSLLVTTPAGDLVGLSDPAIQASREPTWSYARVKLPYRGQTSGTWSAQLVRPHTIYVNGFTTDAFVRLEEGIALVRSQIHRLAPGGARTVLYFEDGRRGDVSVYERALAREEASGTIRGLVRAKDSADFAARLDGTWDLIVVARQMGGEAPEPWDDLLAQLLCRGQRAIVTDTRSRDSAASLKCAGVARAERVNWTELEGDGLLFDGSIELLNPGHEVFSYGLSTSAANVQARADGGRTIAVAARVPDGVEQQWFIDVLGRGLSKLDPHRVRNVWHTGEEVVLAARVRPSYIPAGGYDRVDARVEVQYPLAGAGSLLADAGLLDAIDMKGDLLDARSTSLANLSLPVGTAVFPLNDDGLDGDILAGNFTWSARIPVLGLADGTAKCRFVFDFEKDGCVTRRELTQSVSVDVRVDPRASDPRPGAPRPGPGGRRLVPVQLRPADALGNLWGPGRIPRVTCAPDTACALDPDEPVIDQGDGTYTLQVLSAPGNATAKLSAFGTEFLVPLPCDECPRVEAFEVDVEVLSEGGETQGRIRLTAPAPTNSTGGAVVFLTSSAPQTLRVPEHALVPQGATEVAFPVVAGHLHGEDLKATVEATYGADTEIRTLTVRGHQQGGDDHQDPAPVEPRSRGPVLIIGLCLLLLISVVLILLARKRRA